MNNGDYVICVQLRNRSLEFLEKFKDTKLTIRHEIEEIKIELFSNPVAGMLMDNKEKVEEKYYEVEESSPMFVYIPSYKLPMPYFAGSYLKGKFYVKYPEIKGKVETKITYHFASGIPSYGSSKPNVIEATKETKDTEAELKDLEVKILCEFFRFDRDSSLAWA